MLNNLKTVCYSFTWCVLGCVLYMLCVCVYKSNWSSVNPPLWVVCLMQTTNSLCGFAGGDQTPAAVGGAVLLTTYFDICCRWFEKCARPRVRVQSSREWAPNCSRVRVKLYANGAGGRSRPGESYRSWYSTMQRPIRASGGWMISFEIKQPGQSSLKLVSALTATLSPKIAEQTWLRSCRRAIKGKQSLYCSRWHMLHLIFWLPSSAAAAVSLLALA